MHGPLSPASLCWRMSKRERSPPCQNKASDSGITAVTENVTVPSPNMSTRVNIKATLAALSLLFETIALHWRDNGHGMYWLCGDGETSQTKLYANLWLDPRLVYRLRRRKLGFTNCRLTTDQNVFLWTTMKRGETQQRKRLRELLCSPKSPHNSGQNRIARLWLNNEPGNQHTPNSDSSDACAHWKSVCVTRKLVFILE